MKQAWVKVIRSQSLEHPDVKVQLWLANTWYRRLLGLIPFSGLQAEQGLWLLPGAGIHTFWMRFRIDVLFLDKSHKILKICDNVGPFQLRFAPSGTRSVVEFAAGQAADLALSVGDRFEKLDA